jgi:hypothetical protein
MMRHLFAVQIYVIVVVAAGPAEGRRIGGAPGGLPPRDARQAVRSLTGGAVGGKQHIRRARGWERRGKLRVTEVWNHLDKGHGMSYLAVKREGRIGEGKKGAFDAKHYVSYGPSRRRASYQIEHEGSRTYRHLLRQSYRLSASQSQISRVLGVKLRSPGAPVAGYAIEETRLTHDVPAGPNKERFRMEKGRYYLTSTTGRRIKSLTPNQVMQLNQLDYDNTRR